MAKGKTSAWKSAPRESVGGRTHSNRRVGTAVGPRHGPGKKPKHTSEGRATTARAATRRTAAARRSPRANSNAGRVRVAARSTAKR